MEVDGISTDGSTLLPPPPPLDTETTTSPIGSPDDHDFQDEEPLPSTAAAATDGAPPSSSSSSSETTIVLTDDLKEKIIKQVEYYFSDENLPTDKFLMNHVKKDKQGFDGWIETTPYWTETVQFYWPYEDGDKEICSS